MKKFIEQITIFSITLFIGVISPLTTNAQETKLMSFNVGSSNWMGNRDSVVTRITSNDPDVFCIHEAGEPRRAFLESEPSLSNYRLLQTFGSTPNLSATHIFLKENTFTVVDSGFVQMETYVGYTGLGRYVDWARLQNTSSGSEFYVYASHFVSTFGANADSAQIAQYRHADGMMQLMNQHVSQNIPQITVGDFNANLSSDVMQFILNQTPVTFNSITIINPMVLDDSWDVANPGMPKPPTGSVGSSSIDWILTTTNTDVLSAIIDDQGVNGNGDYPSDHFPLVISFNQLNPTLTLLPIPPLDTGIWVNGVRTFDLLMENSSTEFISGVQTPTSGYNGSFLGPTLYIKTGDDVAINVTNMLGENTTTHWHGLHVPANMDGGPHQMIFPGSTWTATFSMLNEASTFWYHPHHKPAFWQDPDGTGGQVFRGLAGMMIVEDENNDTLSLPNTYGIDEIPLIIQDRAFDANGEFIEFLNPSFIGRPGDTVLVNGAITPTHNTPAQMIRFRILNASNTRTYYLGFSDNRDFHQIASDGGFLKTSNVLNRLRISPAERVEIVIDFSGEEGQSVDLMSYASELMNIQPIGVPIIMDELDMTDYKIMNFVVGELTTNPAPIHSLSPTLNSIPVPNEMDADTSRNFVLSNGPPMTINGVTMNLNVINEIIPLGNTEVWTITNSTGVSHPFHIHGQPFQVLERSDGPVPDSEKGWKDVVFVPFQAPGQSDPGWVKVIKRFEDFADDTFPYMYHCHILEHEDNGMMGQYTVVDTAASTATEDLTQIISDANVFPNPVHDQDVQIEFSSSKSGEYTISLHNQFGQVIKTFYQNEMLGNGHHSFLLNLETISHGVHFISIKSKQDSIVKKLIKL